MKLAYVLDSPGSNPTTISGSEWGQASVEDYSITGSVTIPSQYMYCDQAWLVEASLYWTLGEELFKTNEWFQQVYVTCPDDQLALLDASLSGLPDQWWPILDIMVTTQVTVHNHGVDLAGDPDGLFEVEVYWSLDDVLNLGSDIGVLAYYESTQYSFTEALTQGQTVTTPQLTGAY